MFVFKDLAVGAVSMLIGLIIAIQSRGLVAKTSLDPAGPEALPLIMAWAMIVLGAIHVLGGALAVRKPNAGKKTLSDAFKGFLERNRLVLIVMALGAAFCLLLNLLGYLIALPLLFASILWFLGKRDLKSLLVTNLILTGLLFVMFKFALSVDLPLGPFEKLF